MLDNQKTEAVNHLGCDILDVYGVKATVIERRFYVAIDEISNKPLVEGEDKLCVEPIIRINEDTTFNLDHEIYVIDGSDLKQIEWAHALTDHENKIVLMNAQIAKEHHCEFGTDDIFYFDQGGILIYKLGITQVPARVVRHENYLKIHEIAL